jgi:hypothetical protein
VENEPRMSLLEAATCLLHKLFVQRLLRCFRAHGALFSGRQLGGQSLELLAGGVLVRRENGIRVRKPNDLTCACVALSAELLSISMRNDV